MWVRYRSDAERKRLESILDRYRDRLRILRPSGAVYIVEVGDESTADVFIHELYAKLGDRVSTYLIGGEYRIEPRVYRLKACFTNASIDRVWGYVEAFMIQFRGALVSETRAGRRYSMYVKGEGEARAFINVYSLNDRVCVDVELEGYSQAPEHICSRLREYLTSLGGELVE